MDRIRTSVPNPRISAAAPVPVLERSISDSPLLDLTDAAVKRMIKPAKKRGYVTYRRAERGPALRGGLLRADRGHHVDAHRDGHQRRRDDEEAEAGERAAPRGGSSRSAPRAPARGRQRQGREGAEPVDRTDDPVRMYLREMGSVELLSREGEIAIAKRIEAGREAMIAGLCESPLTFQAIIIWRDELNERQDPAARHHRSRSDLCRPRRQDGADAAGSAAAAAGASRCIAAERRAPRRRGHAPAPRRRISATSERRRRRRRSRTRPTRTTRTTSRSRPWRPSSSRACSRRSTHRHDLQDAAQAAGPGSRGKLTASVALHRRRSARYKKLQGRRSSPT